jgi:hypothetical protein
VSVKRRLLAGIVVSTIVFGVAYAAAASLGLTVDSLAGGQAAVTACDSAVTVSFTTQYDSTAGGYVVDTVDLGGVAAACNTYTVKVTLADSGGTSLDEGTAPATTGTTSVPMNDVALASAVTKVAVSITQP